MAKYKRILIKVSGEALAGSSHSGVDSNAAKAVAQQIKDVAEMGIQVAIVVGGGNFWRGRTGDKMDRVVADQIGMLATVMNALALGDALSQLNVPNQVFSAVTIDKVVRPYTVKDARQCLTENKVVIFGGGTGAPYFTTDTAAVLRACEMNVDALFCSKAVDGIYDSDPKQNPTAKKYDKITFDKVIVDNLKALDLTAVAMCREYDLPVVVFGKDEPNGLQRILKGENLGTIIVK